MRRFFVISSLCIGLCLIAVGSLAAQSAYPDYDELYVNDFAEILSNSQENRVRNAFQQLNVDTGVEATLVTIDSYVAYESDDESFDEFATSLFNSWGIGSSELNNGILLLIALEERSVRIETGVGWENRIKPETQQIIDSEILPQLRDGRMGDGMTAGALAIVDVVRIELDAELRTNTSNAPAEQNNQTAPAQNNSNSTPLISRIFRWVLGLFSVWIVGSGGYMLTRPPKCEHCERELRKLDEQQDDAFLNAGQQTEERIASVDYEVWVCDFDDYVLINRYSTWFSGYSNCTNCSNKTLGETTRVLQKATTRSSGLQEVTKDCKHCDFHRVSEVPLPRIQESSSSSSSRSFGGGGFSSGGGGGGGGSFGGGHSSGGGSSGSW